MPDLTSVAIFFCGFGVGAITLAFLLGLVAANIDKETLLALQKEVEEDSTKMN